MICCQPYCEKTAALPCVMCKKMVCSSCLSNLNNVCPYCRADSNPAVVEGDEPLNIDNLPVYLSFNFDMNGLPPDFHHVLVPSEMADYLQIFLTGLFNERNRIIRHEFLAGRLPILGSISLLGHTDQTSGFQLLRTGAHWWIYSRTIDNRTHFIIQHRLEASSINRFLDPVGLGPTMYFDTIGWFFNLPEDSGERVVSPVIDNLLHNSNIRNQLTLRNLRWIMERLVRNYALYDSPHLRYRIAESQTPEELDQLYHDIEFVEIPWDLHIWTSSLGDIDPEEWQDYDDEDSD